MNKIETLIQELCPEGVAFKALDEVLLKIRTGLNPRQNFVLNPPGASNYYVTVRELAGMGVKWDTKTDRVDDHGLSLIQARSQLRRGDVLFSATGTVGRTALVSSNPVNWNIKEGVYALTPKEEELDSKFLIYLLTSQSIRNGILANTNGSTVQSISMANLVQTRIPVPPLKVQQKIVSILDKFTALEAELEAELEARSAQYESYRDALLDFRTENTSHPLKSYLGGSTFEAVEWVTIGTLGELFPGLTGKSKEDFSYGNSPFVSYLNIGNHASLPRQILSRVTVDPSERQNVIKLGDILFTGSSEDKVGVGLTSEVEYEPDEPTYLNSFCFGLRPERGRFAKGFLKHVFRSPAIRKKIIACANGVTRINISKKLLLKIEVPQPPLVLQEAIVSILDKFDGIVTGTKASLPAEIQARRKQYEYYRNKLLTFKELDAA